MDGSVYLAPDTGMKPHTFLHTKDGTDYLRLTTERSEAKLFDSRREAETVMSTFLIMEEIECCHVEEIDL